MKTSYVTVSLLAGEGKNWTVCNSESIGGIGKQIELEITLIVGI